MTIRVQELVTGEALAEMGDIGRCELVDGALERKTFNSWPHGDVISRLGHLLGIFVEPRKLGLVLVGEVGIYTRRNPDTVRGADVIFISNERLAQVKSKSYLDVAPELVVEVMSPDDRWSEVNKKLREYFAIGVSVVWVADPVDKTIAIYHALTDVQILTVDDTLAAEDILPGLSPPVAALFAD